MKAPFASGEPELKFGYNASTSDSVSFSGRTTVTTISESNGRRLLSHSAGFVGSSTTWPLNAASDLVTNSRPVTSAPLIVIRRGSDINISADPGADPVVDSRATITYSPSARP